MDCRRGFEAGQLTLEVLQSTIDLGDIRFCQTVDIFSLVRIVGTRKGELAVHAGGEAGGKLALLCGDKSSNNLRGRERSVDGCHLGGDAVWEQARNGLVEWKGVERCIWYGR